MGWREQVRWSSSLTLAGVGIALLEVGGAPLLLLVAGVWIVSVFFIRSDLVETKAQAIGLSIVAWCVWLVGTRYAVALFSTSFPAIVRFLLITAPSIAVMILVLWHCPANRRRAASQVSLNPIDLTLGGSLALMLVLKVLAGSTYRAIAMSGDSRNHALIADTYLQDGKYLFRSRYPGFVNILMGYLVPFNGDSFARPQRVRQLIDVLPIVFFFGALMIGVGCIIFSEVIGQRLGNKRCQNSNIALWFAPIFVLAPVFIYPVLIDGFLTVGVAAGLLAIALSFSMQTSSPVVCIAGAVVCAFLLGVFPPIVLPLVIVLLVSGIVDTARKDTLLRIAVARIGILISVLFAVVLAWDDLRTNLRFTGSIQPIPPRLVAISAVLALTLFVSRNRRQVAHIALLFVLLFVLTWFEISYIRSVADLSPNGDAYYASKLILILTGGVVGLFLVPSLLLSSTLARYRRRRVLRPALTALVGALAIAGFAFLNDQADIPSAIPAIQNEWFRPNAESVDLIRSELERDGRFVVWRFTRLHKGAQGWDAAEDRLANFWSALTWSGPTIEDQWAWDWAYGGINTLEATELCGILQRYSGIRVITRDHLLGSEIGDVCGSNDDTLVVLDS